VNDLAIIFQAEFLRKIRSRPFLIGTLLGAVAIVALSFLPNILANAIANSSKNIVLAGEPTLVAQAKTLLAKDFKIVATIPPLANPPKLADLDRYEKASAIAELTRDASGLNVTAYAKDASAFSSSFGEDLVALNIALATNLSQKRIDPLLNVPVHVQSLDTKFTDRRAADAARSVAYVLVLLLYMSILINSQTVMASVAEEKTSRIAELLVATTSPAYLLGGKIFAAGLAGLIQLIVWLGAGFFAGSRLADSMAERGGSHAATVGSGSMSLGSFDISTGVIAAFVLFFIIGFVQYATLYAAAASLINRTEDLGSVAAPLVIPVITGFLLAQYTLFSPNSTLVQILSQVPLLAPFVMFTRLAATTVPVWQIVLSILINAGATILIIWGAGKVYRVGLLLYGRPPNIRQVIAALRA